MSSQGHLRYPPQPPPSSSASDFRLPSLKDLNFQYRPPPVASAHEHPAEQAPQYPDFVPQDQPTSSTTSPNSFSYSYPSTYPASHAPYSPPPPNASRTTALVPTTLDPRHSQYHASTNTTPTSATRPDTRLPTNYVPSIAAATRQHPQSPEARYPQHSAESRYAPSIDLRHAPNAPESRYHGPPPSTDSRPTTGYSATTELKPTLISSGSSTDLRTPYDQNGRASYEQNGRSAYENSRAGFDQNGRTGVDHNARVAYEQNPGNLRPNDPRTEYEANARSTVAYDPQARTLGPRSGSSSQSFTPTAIRMTHEPSRPPFVPSTSDATRAPSEPQRAYIYPAELRQYPPAEARSAYPASDARPAYSPGEARPPSLGADTRSAYPAVDARSTYPAVDTRPTYPAADTRPAYSSGRPMYPATEARPAYPVTETRHAYPSAPPPPTQAEQRPRHGHTHPPGERYAPQQPQVHERHATHQSQASERYVPQQSQGQESDAPQPPQSQERYPPQQLQPHERYQQQQQEAHEPRSAHPHAERYEETAPVYQHAAPPSQHAGHPSQSVHTQPTLAHYSPGYSAHAQPHAHTAQLPPPLTHNPQLHPHPPPHLHDSHSHDPQSHPHQQKQSQSLSHPQPHPHPHPSHPHPPHQSYPHQPSHPHHSHPQPQSHSLLSQHQQAPLQNRPDPEAKVEKGKDDIIQQVVKHCTALYDFANRYAHLQSSLPHVQPTPTELAEMTHHAAEVVRLLELLRDGRSLSHPPSQAPQPHTPLIQAQSQVQPHAAQPMDVDDHDHRAPKRPWEEEASDAVDSKRSNSSPYDPAALKDMEIIRTKRALTTSLAAAAASGGSGPGSGTGSSNNVTASGPGGGGLNGNGGGNAGKSKYRKRSSGQRATPPGKCHSCNIRETPEWRRGPDGARTLCNACGLHYAKLVRKREKALAADGNAHAARIDMEMLRASARAAEGEKAARGGGGGGEAMMGMGMGMVHQGSFQIMGIGPTGPDGDQQPQYPPHQPRQPPPAPSSPAHQHPNTQLPWTGPQSFMRTSHSVSASSGASPA
ncbi:hypothetical protein BV22DRAFT_1032966 [Leucogyrophana mollusca]|uniref:Uncharacterized protein n=1 Tax=Leucogyrophana mollusca TaxID=85980 RepID=A0ACB8BMD0_9AGAM|nr:hypothetical protein BV22DRAFT_1032966 [Leucogyrophana mollusca]